MIENAKNIWLSHELETQTLAGKKEKIMKKLYWNIWKKCCFESDLIEPVFMMVRNPKSKKDYIIQSDDF